MRLNYLILAHKNPEQLARMIERLNGENIFFFVHIDADIDIISYKKNTDSIFKCIPLGKRIEIEGYMGAYQYSKSNFESYKTSTYQK